MTRLLYFSAVLAALSLGSCAKEKASPVPAPESFTYTLDGQTMTTGGSVEAGSLSSVDFVTLKSDSKDVVVGNQTYQQQVTIHFEKPTSAPPSAYEARGAILVERFQGTIVWPVFYSHTSTSTLIADADGWTGTASGVAGGGPSTVQLTFSNIRN